MKHLKEKATGNLLKTSNEAAAEKIESGLFVYTKKGVFQRYFKEQQKQNKRFKKRKPPVFNSGETRKALSYLAKYCTTKKDKNGDDILKNGEKQFILKLPHRININKAVHTKYQHLRIK